MTSESLPERVKRVVDPHVLGEASTLDTQDPVQVDRVALALIESLNRRYDEDVYRLFIDVTQDLLRRVASDVCRDEGLIMDVDDVITTYYARLLLEVKSQGTRRTFLAEATRQIEQEAVSWIRDIALTDTADVIALATHTDPPSRATYERIVSICFHRLDLRERRLLRAREVEGLTVDELATRLGQPIEDVRAELLAARHRLDEAVTRAQGGSES